MFEISKQKTGPEIDKFELFKIWALGLMLASDLNEDILSLEVRVDNIVTVHKIQGFGDFNNETLQLINVVLDLVD